jgi:hypothetical protein
VIAKNLVVNFRAKSEQTSIYALPRTWTPLIGDTTGFLRLRAKQKSQSFLVFIGKNGERYQLN